MPVELEGGSPKGHKKVTRSDGSFYWRRTKKSLSKGIKHHKQTRSSRKRSGSRSPSAYAAHVRHHAKLKGISYREAQKHPEVKKSYFDLKNSDVATVVGSVLEAPIDLAEEVVDAVYKTVDAATGGSSRRRR